MKLHNFYQPQTLHHSQGLHRGSDVLCRW